MIEVDHVRVHLAVGQVDTRKSIDGLALLVSGFSLEPVTLHALRGEL